MSNKSPSPTLFNTTVNSPKRNRECNEGDKVDFDLESPQNSIVFEQQLKPGRKLNYIDTNAMPRDVLENIKWDQPSGFDALGRPQFRTINQNTIIETKKQAKNRKRAGSFLHTSGDLQPKN